jgi:flagellar protein FlaG
MAEAAVPSLLVFIASLLVAAGVAGVFSTELGGLSEDIRTLGPDVSDTVRVDLEVVTDPGAQVYYPGASEVRVHVKNTGARTLSADPLDIDLRLDGTDQPASALEVTVLGGGDWSPGHVVRIDVAAAGLSSGTHRIAVGVDGYTEVFEFTV